MKNSIYVTGHMRPDTDSIASAIAYAYLKNKMGIECEACRLGNLNEETKYLLNRFGFEEPRLLKDARFSLNEIELAPAVTVRTDATIHAALQAMKTSGLSAIAVTNENDQYEGIVSFSDIASLIIGDASAGIEIMKKTSVENIASCIDGRVVYADPDRELNGEVTIISEGAAQAEEKYIVKDRIVLLGNDVEVQKAVIGKGAAVLIIVWAEEVDEEILKYAKKKHCSVILSGQGTLNTSRYLYYAPAVSAIVHPKAAYFDSEENVDEVAKKMTESRYSEYPVLDSDKHVLGYVTRYHLMSVSRRKMILVDHNEFSQSVDHIEYAEILEVVDHHRISDFKTAKPINFRNETTGSTATIITGMFQERQIFIPENIAALLLGAILSDTMNFTSPTTTQRDIFMANVLSQISGLNISDFARDVFGIYKDALKKPMTDLVRTDVKIYDFAGHTALISQVMVYELCDLAGREEEIREAARGMIAGTEDHTAVICFTGVIDKGSEFFAEGKRKASAESVYPAGVPMAGVVSRKLQVVPALTKALSE